MSISEPLETRRLLSVNVSTYHYSNAETGANTSETLLTQANVNTGTFGKVASMPVDGQIYGQPLIMTNVPMSNGQGTHDIALITTENDSVYAFDADGNNPAQGYLWKTSLLQAGETTVPETDYGTTDITPQLGITGSPVVNPATGVMYVVGLFKETATDTYEQRIYALSISSGTNAIAPVLIAANVSGSTYSDPGGGYTNPGGVVSFDAFRENQRPALTLANGEVYVGWSSHGDENPWHGWIIAYNAATLHEDYAYCDTPNGEQGGIWMSGGGIAVNAAGDLFYTTGNGSFDANGGAGDYGMALEELSPSLQPLDYFAPYNQQNLSNADLDFGCANVILLPTQSGSYPDEVLSAGKWGSIYLNDSDTGELGEYNPNGTGPNDDLGEATLQGASGNGSAVHNTMVYWNGTVYLGGDGLTLQAFSAGNGVLGTVPTSQTARDFGSTGKDDGQGAGLTVSSNGTSNGIVWALDNSGFLNTPAVLYAYNASNLSDMLWNSSQAIGGRDTCGIGIKFQDPVVANGYVYVAGDGALTVYGLINPSTATPTLVTAAAANPPTVTGATTDLSVLASDPAADLRPIYVWSVTTSPAGAVAPAFSINSSNAANDPVVTFYQAGAYTFTATITDPNSQLSVTSSVNVTVTPVLTAITISPASTTMYEGSSQQLTATVVDQFGNALAAQPQFNWTVNSGGAGGTVTSTGIYTAPAASTGTDTVTATADSLSASATVLVVNTNATIPVNLSPYDNTLGIVTDGVPFAGGLDGGGSAYSGTLLGTSLVWTGSTFTIPAPTPENNQSNVVESTNQTITFSRNKYSAIKFLGAQTDGNAPGLAFVVTYSDGTTQTFTQSCSDWYTPQNYPGESTALAMAYRVNNNGQLDNRPFYLFGYSFALNPNKTLSSIKLPNNNLENVVAMDLVGIGSPVPTVTTPAAASPTPVTGKTTTLSVLGADPVGDAAPIYTWAASNLPNGAITPAFSVNGTAAANVSTATFYQAGNYTFTVTITDPTSALSTTSSVTVTVNQVTSGIAVSPSTATVPENTSQQFTASAVDQFGNALAAQPQFTWAVASNGAGGSISASGLYTSPAYSGTDTITASSGGLDGSATVIVTAPLVSTPVNLAGDFNIVGIVADGTTFSGAGGEDRQGSAYSGTLLGTSQTWNGSSFTIPATTAANNVDNVISGNGQTIVLPQNNDTALKLLAAHVNGNAPALVLTVNYTDGTTQTITQGISDWYTPQNYAGESTVAAMPHRDLASGAIDNRPFYLYGYSFSLNSAKTIQSITLPNDDNFDIVAMDTVAAGPPAWLGTASQATWNPSTKILTVTGPTTIIADPGTDQPVIQANGSAAVVTINPAGSLQIHLGGLSLTHGASAIVTSLGAARTATNHRVLVLGLPGATSAPLLAIDSSSRLDLTNNDMLDRDGGIAAVNGVLKSGFNSGSWNGNGILSSIAATGTLGTLGSGQPAVAGVFDSQTTGTSDVEIRYTYSGDANLDGHVDGSDYSLIDNGLLHTLTGWSNGDFNYDGVVNGSDYTLIDNSFNQQAASLDAEVASPAAESATATPATAEKPPTTRPTLGSTTSTSQPDTAISRAHRTAIDSLLNSTVAPSRTRHPGKPSDKDKSDAHPPTGEMYVHSPNRSKAVSTAKPAFSDVRISIWEK